MQAIVLQSTGSWYKVKTQSGMRLDCRLPGRFKQEEQRFTNPIAVGDTVILKKDTLLDTYIIQEILPRKNYIIRQSPRQKNLKHIVASNIDQALLIMTIASPRTSLGFVDRFLVTTESYHIPCIIVVNKIDLLSSKEIAKLEELKKIYSNLNYPILETSTLTNQGMEQIRNLLLGKTTLLIGHSGAGKSSIVNALNPQLNLKTASVSAKWNKGTHTTTFASMYEIFENSYIIDTPGIKELFVVEMEPQELGGYFLEIKAWSRKCQYNNCLHENEPNCAVKKAYLERSISKSRYNSYLTILENIRSVDYWKR